MRSMVSVVQRRGAAPRSSLDHLARGAEPHETQQTTPGAGRFAGEVTLALAFPAARRAMRQPQPVQLEGIYPPHAPVRLGMLRLESVRMRGRKVRTRQVRMAGEEKKRVGFPPRQPGRKRARAERDAREGAASRAKLTRGTRVGTMLGVRTSWTCRCSRRPSPRSQRELPMSWCRCQVERCFGYRPSTAKRDGVSLETIQALKLVRDVDGSVSKTRARCGARARPFGVLCDATPRGHLIQQPPGGQKMGNTGALTRHVPTGRKRVFVTQEFPVWWAPSSNLRL